LQNEIAALESQAEFYKKAIANFRKQLVDNEQNRNYYQQQIERKEAIVKQLREEWNKINAEKFEFDESNSVCPTCEQEIPAHIIESKIESLQANFNADVARRKKEKVDYSGQVKAEIAQLKEKLSSLNDDSATASINEATAKMDELYNSIVIKENTLANASKGQDDVIAGKLSSSKEYNALKDEIVSLEAGIEQEAARIRNSEPDTSESKERKFDIQIKLDDLKKRLAIKDTIAKAEQRIEQLIKEEADNAQAVAEVEKSEFEVETFIRAKMNILEEKVNSKFGYVKFRLFDKQVNGAIVETCVCEYENVPYPTLNTAAKILAGLDIIETFSNYYQTSAPVFIDNRESTSWIPPINSQIINLYVSPDDTILRIEQAGGKAAKKQKAAATELFPMP
jgi:exonuclease SbcC